MNVSVTHFASPFSFFIREKSQNNNFVQDNMKDHSYTDVFSKKHWTDVNHGQYIAVWHQNKWARGVVSMESQVLIWLVDFGYYLRPAESTTYVDLPAEFKKLPSKVIEASIHGVMPVDKMLSEDCEIKDIVSTTWNHGAVEKGQNTIQSCRSIYFVPVALMCTKGNDVVLGDLYLDIPGQGVVNFIDLMEQWPVFLQKNQKGYVENLSTFYTSRRKHHASTLKPVTASNDLPQMSPSTSLPQYETIVSNATKLELDEDSSSDDCSTIVTKQHTDTRLTAEELEEYSQMYIKFNGAHHNVLNIIINKCRDLSLCEKYKNKKSAGRATTRQSMYDNDRQLLYTEDFE